jgi:hypothetical protein
VDVLAFLASLGWRQRVQGLRAVTIGSGELNGRWKSSSVADQMTFAAQLGSVGWIRSCLATPKTARIKLPSTMARDRSIPPWRANQSSKEKWISCQIPASCQSRNPSRSSPYRGRVPVAASAREFRCAVRTEFP